MKKIEFWCTPEGEVRFRTDSNKEEKLDKFSKDVIESVLFIVESRFPVAYKTLMKAHDEVKDEAEKRYRMTEHFVRCNFGSHDTLTYDVVNTRFNLEEVKCPMRGRTWLCPYEGVICKPYKQIKLTQEQKDILQRYCNGMDTQEIADDIGKKKNTVKNILAKLKEKFGVKTAHALLTCISVNEILL